LTDFGCFSFLATGWHGGQALIQTEGLKAYGLYMGPVLIIAGFIIGKFWSLKYKPKRSSAGNE